jgi:hypothetical protein
MTVKFSSLSAAVGCLLAVAACNNSMPESETNPTGTAGTPAPGTGVTAGKSAAGSSAAGSTGSNSAGSGQQPSAAGRTASGMAGSGAAGTGDDETDAGLGETAGSPAAGSGGAQAGAGAAGTSGAAGEGGAAVRPPCLTKQSQLVAVGDSYLNWITHTFPDDFRTEFGEYRMYAVGGASMGSGGIAGFIPDQLTMAISEDSDILAAVMTGGGNDILIADTAKYPGSDTCKDRTDAPMDKVCQDVIANAMDVASKLMDTAANAGIRDVVYLFYPHIPGGGFGGMNPNAILDYSLPMARDLCLGASARTEGKLTCHFIDLVPVFDGHPDWFADDGIHENNLGSAAMAKEVVKVLKEKCVAQPAASGCCTQ